MGAAYRCPTRLDGLGASQGGGWGEEYLFGATCPQRRIAAGLVLPAANAETMSLHLATIGRKVTTGKPF
jgi:hypothetical protein